MMTKKQIKEIAENCGVKVSYTTQNKGGFIFDSSKKVYESVHEIFISFFQNPERCRRVYLIDDESVLLAA